MKKFPFYKQANAMDCAPACIKMVAEYYGGKYTISQIKGGIQPDREGLSLLELSEMAEQIGFEVLGLRVNFKILCTEIPLPCIIHWDNKHFVVIYQIKDKIFSINKQNKKQYKFYIADPAYGKRVLSEEDFLTKFKFANADEGIILLLQPTERFQTQYKGLRAIDFTKVYKYLFNYKWLIFQVLLGFALGAALQVSIPLLTQSIIDIGIKGKDINYITIILASQLVLLISRLSVDYIRRWVLLHISSRLNIHIILEFLSHFIKLPISFFERRSFGESVQRIDDQQRIEEFLTNTSLTALFSFFNLIVFSLLLLNYSKPIFCVYLVTVLLSAAWFVYFTEHRKRLDYDRFRLNAVSHSLLAELINGITEIKLANFEEDKLLAWSHNQSNLFGFKSRLMQLEQYQRTGLVMFNELRNIIILFLTSISVIKGQLTLGEMLAIQYAIGQLGQPFEALLDFTQVGQYAKLSFERLQEVRETAKEDESAISYKLTAEELDSDIVVRNVSFGYDTIKENNVIHNISLTIPKGKITAIVGPSGSGKTTLMKLLLKFYAPVSGSICLGDVNMLRISHHEWRQHCGVVLQDSFIFSDTIENNVRMSNRLNKNILVNATKLANIYDFITSLPHAFQTQIGSDGNGISQGQKQRILLARLIYKNPHFLFLDEATNSLDTINESVIMDNLQSVFKGKTVCIIAHRLSTVRNADKIVVLSNGKVCEEGTHSELLSNNSIYAKLVREQLTSED